MSMDIFTNPVLRAKAQKIRNTFELEGVDGMALYNELKELVIQQGEWNFEQEIIDHQHGMAMPGENKTFWPDIEEWLKAQFSEDDYILMPKHATGKYKDFWNWIYFKNKDQAMLFKLTWK